ncbi:RNA polymerase subunit sigma-70 [Vibrio cholerae]
MPFLLESAAVLATFVHSNHIVYLLLMGTHSLAAYLQLQVVWVYCIDY